MPIAFVVHPKMYLLYLNPDWSYCQYLVFHLAYWTGAYGEMWHPYTLYHCEVNPPQWIYYNVSSFSTFLKIFSNFIRILKEKLCQNIWEFTIMCIPLHYDIKYRAMVLHQGNKSSMINGTPHGGAKYGLTQVRPGTTYWKISKCISNNDFLRFPI